MASAAAAAASEFSPSHFRVLDSNHQQHHDESRRRQHQQHVIRIHSEPGTFVEESKRTTATIPTTSATTTTPAATTAHDMILESTAIIIQTETTEHKLPVATSSSTSSSTTTTISTTTTTSPAAANASILSPHPPAAPLSPVLKPLPASAAAPSSPDEDAHKPASPERLAAFEKKQKETATAGDTPAWQLLPIPSVVEQTQSRVNVDDPSKSLGLTSKEAAEKLVKHGKNVITPPPETPLIVQFLRQFLDPFKIVLLLAGILSCIAYLIDTSQGPTNLYLGFVLFFITMVSCIFSFIQERQSDALMNSFGKLLPRSCTVIRDGKPLVIPAAEVVVGDLVRVKTGDQAPADLRVIWVAGLKTELTALTGESRPVSVTLTSSETSLVHASNMVFSSCNCVDGEGLGIVVATGDQTMIGCIAGLAQNQEAEPTTLQKEFTRVVQFISVVAVVMATTFFILGVLRGHPLLTVFVNGVICVLVANIPQGLPMTVMSCLTIVARRMASKNVFVKRLQNVETLGSASVIASDKTGTLTMNQMSAANLWFDRAFTSAASVIRDPKAMSQTLGFLELVAAVNNRAQLQPDESLSGATNALLLRGPSAVSLRIRPSIFASQNSASNLALATKAAIKELAQKEEQKQQQQQQQQVVAPPKMQARMTRSDSIVMTIQQQLQQQTQIQVQTPNQTPAVPIRGMVEQKVPNSESGGTFTRRLSISKHPGLEALRQNLAPMKVVGDASDSALFRFVDSFNDDVTTIRGRWTEVFSIPFNSSYKYALTIVRSKETGQALLLLKGAPEVIINWCSEYSDRGQPIPIDERFHHEFEEACLLFGSMGERVLGFAMMELPLSDFPPERDHLFNKEAKNYPTAGLRFLGLISLIDPPKPGVTEAILECRRAGIRVIMVTGDHPITAAAIAKKVGIITQDQSSPDASVAVVTGTELERYQDPDWENLLSKKELVLARTTPQQKLELVKHLQRRGDVVAVTGDGVNDAPALKKADIGVAMGISGSDVARDAADMILMDDNFSSLVTGICEGRVIFDNLTKTIAYTLSHLWPEIMPVLCNLAFGLPLALSAVLILCVDLGTELFPAISLSYEEGEPDVMDRPPRNIRTDRLVTFNVISYCYFQAGFFECLMCFIGYLLVFIRHGIPASALWDSADNYFIPGARPLVIGNRVYLASEQMEILAEAQSTYFMVLVMSQFFHIWFCRTRKGAFFSPGFRNMVLNYGVVVEVAILCLIVFTPGLQTLFSTRGTEGIMWLIPLGSLIGFGLYSEIVKWFARNRKDSCAARWLAW